MRPVRPMPVAALLALAAGCAPPPPPDPITTSAPLPVFTAAAGASATRDHDGVAVTVRPVTYTTAPQQQEWADELGTFDRVTLFDDGTEVHEPMRVFQWSAAVVPTVRPDRLAFVVDVANRSARPFRGAGVTARFVVAGRTFAPENAMGLAAMVVPPGGHDAVTLYGPRLSAVPPGAAVGLRLSNQAGDDDRLVPTASATQWSYAYDAPERSTTTTPTTVVAEKPLDPPPTFSWSAWVSADAGPAYPW